MGVAEASFPAMERTIAALDDPTVLRGAVHLTIFAVFLFLAIVP